jgi:predicted nucleic acid-binding protein
VTVVAIYDANVLYPSALRDLLVRIGDARLVQPRWTDEILDETFGSLIQNRPDLDPAKLQRTRELMNSAIRDVLVEGYEQHIDRVALPDPNDRHVLAAAIQAGASVIVTKNSRDFPQAELSKWGMIAQHPDDFLSSISERNAEKLAALVEDMALAWRSPRADADSVLDQLAVDIPSTVAGLRILFTVG